MSKLMSEEQIERLFQNHLDDKVGSGTLNSFYGRNKGMKASARTAFIHAFTILMPIIEKQNEALNYYGNRMGMGGTARQAIQETKQILEKLTTPKDCGSGVKH